MNIDVFWGEITDHYAMVYLRAPRQSPGDRWRGTIVGPVSQQGATLTSEFEIRDLGPGNTVMAGARIVDPCCWSPEMAFHYEVRATLECGQDSLNVQQQLGIRRLGCHARDFRFDTERWVLRGVRATDLRAEEIEWYRGTNTTLVLSRATEETLQLASVHGVPILLLLDKTSSGEKRLRELARISSVAFVVVPTDTDESVRQFAPNLLFGKGGTIVDDDWCDFWFLPQQTVATTSIPTTRPVVVVGDQPALDVQQARRDCDHLQRDLVPYGDFAGYVA